jgi:membrane associated rhomboid family serine protease
MEGDAERSAPDGGSTDFSGYSLNQLQDLQKFMDRAAYPRDSANLAAEIERRLAAAAVPVDNAANSASAGRFSSSDGWLGWLQGLRRRSPVFGAGELEILADTVRLSGNHRTWLGSSAPREYRVQPGEIRNCAADGPTLRFEIKRRLIPARTIEFRTGNESEARALLAKLPETSTASFARRWQESREFNQRLDEIGSRRWLAPVLVLANIAVFVAMAIAGKTLDFSSDPTRLMDWGANYGPLTMAGAWWRLVSAFFLHANVVHLLLNMWVLWNVGRLTERLYGTALFAFLYFMSGICASLARIVWEPGIASVGASGAIFGMLGALLAMLLNPKARIPRSIAFAYWPSTLLFALFNLGSGFLDPFVDNVAHVGGLLSGFAFGWICVRPIDREHRAAFPLRQSAIAAVLAIAIAGASFVQLHGAHGRTTITEQFMLKRPWYVRGESETLQLWQQLAWRASSGTISEAEISERFDKDIIPFWKDAQTRLAAEIPRVSPAEKPLHDLMREFVRLRLAWAEAVRDVARAPDAGRVKEIGDLAKQTSKMGATIQRLSLRSTYDQRPRALSTSAPVLKVKSWFSAGAHECVLSPPDDRVVSPARDAPGDGPKTRHQLGCRAQRLFVAGDYQALENLIVASSRKVADLADGGSSLSGLFDGLDDFFEYSGNDVTYLLGKTSDWRRAVDDPVGAELAEILVFRNWAWAARGHGTADSVSQEAWQYFALRNEMAAAGIEALRTRAAANPYWYQVALNSALDRQVGDEELDRLFDAGARRFPDYLPIYGSRMRALMPRWGGSVGRIEAFINDAAEVHAGALTPDERYATLYALYSRMEDDEINLFAAGNADWQRIQDGFGGLRRRYPRSDLVLNQFAKFACMAGDGQRYSALRPYVGDRLASLAWSKARSVETCDAMFGAHQKAAADSSQ